MEGTDLVTIVTPMYNSMATIKNTIASVQAQTYSTWEMIIVDDCSTDGCAAYVEQCAKADGRIRLLHHHKN